ncbi:hypothetical protein DPMN_167709 [Dreissena polymorpha]|uniref:Uncharacterized protein n=1 Tax=Dreissena polymorpha TaxID=45954 RepID=A0A9D4IYL6_DREPO|nr:hypothetical protein DPMN_167709 [Dreissena polymorpha]
MGIVDFDGVVDRMLHDCQQNTSDADENAENADKELYDSDAEKIKDENVGNIDTLLDDADAENRHAFTFAPGEGQQHISR